jgi:stress response protein YsnF
VDRKERSDRFTELEEQYKGYEVFDPQGEKIGKVDDLFINENDQPEYIGVKMGFLGLRSTLIPMEMVRVNETDKTIEVSESKDHVKDAPSFDDDEEITPEYENTVRSYFGLEDTQTPVARGSYGAHDPSGRAGEDYTAGEHTDASEDEPEEYQERPGAATGARYREEGSRADVLEEYPSARSEEERTGAEMEDRERTEPQDYPGISIGGREGREAQERSAGTADPGSGGDAKETDRVRVRRIGEGSQATTGTAGESQVGAETVGEPQTGSQEHPAETRGAGPEDASAETERTGAVRRTLGESQAGTETDAGEYESESMRVRKQVRTDREQIRVPKKREEVHVERVPTEEGGEELRVRKEVVEDEEIVEVDVSKEEVNVEDETEQRSS